MEIFVFYPVYRFLKGAQKTSELGLNDLCDILSENPIMFADREHLIEIDRSEPTAEQLEKIRKRRTFDPDLHGVWAKAKFKVTDKDEDWVRAQVSGYPEDAYRQSTINLATEEFQKYYEKALIPASILYPGYFLSPEISYFSEFGDPYYSNLEPTVVDTLKGDFTNHTVELRNDLPLASIYSWMKEKPIWSGQKSNSNVDQAICAYSYMIKSRSGVEMFAWAMIGLESILTSSDKTSEFSNRIPSLLPMVDAKKLKKLYNYRSRLFHGDLNLRLETFREYDFKDDALENEWETIVFAGTILTQILQILAIKKANSISFSVSVYFDQ